MLVLLPLTSAVDDQIEMLFFRLNIAQLTLTEKSEFERMKFCYFIYYKKIASKHVNV